MSNPVGRLYAVAGALVTFFVAWALVAQDPWTSATPDPRVTALQQREAQIARETAAAEAALAARVSAYHARLATQAAASIPAAVVTPSPAPAPPVQVVPAPSVTRTRTS